MRLQVCKVFKANASHITMTKDAYVYVEDCILILPFPGRDSSNGASCSRRDIVRNGKQDDLLALAELHGCKVVWHDDIQRYIRAYFRQFDAELHKVAPPLTITPHKFLTVVDTSGEYQPLVHVRTSGLLFLLAFLL